MLTRPAHWFRLCLEEFIDTDEKEYMWHHDPEYHERVYRAAEIMGSIFALLQGRIYAY